MSAAVEAIKAHLNHALSIIERNKECSPDMEAAEEAVTSAIVLFDVFNVEVQERPFEEVMSAIHEGKVMLQGRVFTVEKQDSTWVQVDSEGKKLRRQITLTLEDPKIWRQE